MRVSLRILLLLAVAPVLRAAEPAATVPTLQGHFAGDLDLSALPGAPPLHWTVSIDHATTVTQELSVTADGPGTQMRIALTVDPAKGTATWKLLEGKFDLAVWERVAQARFATELSGLSFAGTVSLTGHGVMAGSAVDGEVVVDVRDGSVRNEGAGWSVEGIALGGYFAFDSRQRTIRSTTPLTLGVRTITTRRFGARNLTVNGRLEDTGHFALSTGRMEIAGGDMDVAPTAIDLSPFRIVADVTFNRIGLPDVAALVPSALRSATGRVDGTVRLAWSAATGFQLGKGHLVLRKDEAAEVTLRPFPGLFTSGFQGWLKRVMNAPHWLIRSPLTSLREAEMGEAPIEAQSLDVTFSPDPDAEGRYAVVKLTGLPKGKEMRTPVDVTADIHAPLDPFIQLGAKAKLSFGIH